jgi:hypothetical protein
VWQVGGWRGGGTSVEGMRMEGDGRKKADGDSGFFFRSIMQFNHHFRL